ncbi:uncharacterized protein IL334_001487 [Kwoniella shivajii]|uniref:Karyogamy protein 5 n=1 Tax=Kwoniella shivajii TaxID=564305 RepID=A0ABZ1CS45_9TREE|nr:hypothetical protein IL334_001487 [Kwoniella shivajii]
MHRATFLILGLVLQYAHATSSSPQGYFNHETESQKSGQAPGGLVDSSHEFNLGETSLAQLTRSLTRSECHADIAKRLQHSCKKEGDVVEGFSELNKRSVAISFTICSLQSALQSVPVECLSWSTASITPNARRSENTVRLDDQQAGSIHEQQKLCLGPQEWSAYNVYLSDATQLCHALEARKEADVIHERFKNATIEKMNLLNLMKRREESQLDREKKSQIELEIRSKDLHDTFDLVISAHRRLRGDIEESSHLAQDLRFAFSAFEAERTMIWERIEHDLKDRLLDTDARFEAIVFDMKDNLALEHNRVISDNAKGAAQALQVRIRSTLNDIDSFTNHMSEQMAWEGISHLATVATSELDLLGMGFEQLHNTLASSAELSQAISLEQHNMTRSLAIASQHAHRLFETQGHLETALNRSLSSVTRGFGITGLSFSLFSTPSIVSFSSIRGLGVHLLICFAQMLWQILYSTASALCCLLIVFRTGLKKSISSQFGNLVRHFEDEEAAISTRRVEPPMPEREMIRPLRDTSKSTYPPLKISHPHAAFLLSPSNRRMRRSVSTPL